MRLNKAYCRYKCKICNKLILYREWHYNAGRTKKFCIKCIEGNKKSI